MFKMKNPPPFPATPIRLPFAALAALALLSPLASAGCYEPIKNRLPRHGVVLFGEIHGNRETPAFFNACVREFLDQGETVAIALEYPRDENPLAQRYLKGEASEAQLIEGAHWRDLDGRSSAAMLEVFRFARQARQDGARIDLFGFDVENGFPGDGRARDAAMARHFATRYRARGYYLALTGNAHAQRQVGLPWDPEQIPFALHLSRTVPTLLSFDTRSDAGQTWMCAEQCGVHPLSAHRQGVPADAKPGALLFASTPGFDGVFYIGSPSVSPPATKQNAAASAS